MSQENKQQVIVGMSGGVDSSVSAMLLKQQGYAVSGMFMKNWEEDDRFGACPAEQDAADAAAVCEKLGLKLHTRNFAAEYWDNVFEHFLDEYRSMGSFSRRARSSRCQGSLPICPGRFQGTWSARASSMRPASK